jgi:hypothetical protein
MKFIVTLLFTFFVFLPALPCWATISGHSFTLLYSNDVRGETEPCG